MTAELIPEYEPHLDPEVDEGIEGTPNEIEGTPDELPPTPEPEVADNYINV